MFEQFRCIFFCNMRCYFDDFSLIHFINLSLPWIHFPLFKFVLLSQINSLEIVLRKLNNIYIFLQKQAIITWLNILVGKLPTQKLWIQYVYVQKVWNPPLQSTPFSPSKWSCLKKSKISTRIYQKVPFIYYVSTFIAQNLI